MTEALRKLMLESVEDLRLLSLVLEERYEDAYLSVDELIDLVEETVRAIALRRKQLADGALGSKVTAKEMVVRESILDGLAASDDVTLTLARIERLASEAVEANQSVLLIGD